MEGFHGCCTLPSLRTTADTSLRPRPLQPRCGPLAQPNALLFCHGCENANNGFLEDARAVEVLLCETAVVDAVPLIVAVRTPAQVKLQITVLELVVMAGLIATQPSLVCHLTAEGTVPLLSVAFKTTG